jgi:hypothetical protein
MFSINDYNYNTLSSSQSGGNFGGTIGALGKLGVYLLLLIAFIFDVVGPLTESKAQTKFKKNSELFTSFVIFSVIIPILIFYFIWISDGQSQKKKKGTIAIIAIFMLLQFSTTLAALIYSNAYSDENTKIRVLFYFRIVFLYIGMTWAVIVSSGSSFRK